MELITRFYDDAEKLRIIEEYMHSGESKESFQTKKRDGTLHFIKMDA